MYIPFEYLYNLNQTRKRKFHAQLWSSCFGIFIVIFKGGMQLILNDLWELRLMI